VGSRSRKPPKHPIRLRPASSAIGFALGRGCSGSWGARRPHSAAASERHCRDDRRGLAS